jgi:chitodextrinase
MTNSAILKMMTLLPRMWGNAGRTSRTIAIASIALVWMISGFASAGVAYGATGPAFVQEKDRQITRGTANSVTFSAPTTPGNLIVVYVIWDSTSAVSVSDTRGNIYYSAGGPTLWNNSKYSTQVFYAKNIQGGTDTVTATFAKTVRSFGIVYIHEYTQVDPISPIDGISSAVGSGTSMDSGPVVTTTPGDLLFGAGVSSYIVTRPGTYFTARSTAKGNITEDRIVTGTGAYSATATNGWGGWAMQVVAFRPVSSTAADISAPSVPTGLSATAISSTQVNLSWAASTDGDNSSSQLLYRVYRNGTLAGTTSAGVTTWQDSGLQAATTYSYTVSALDAAGNASAPSASAQVTTPSAMPTISSFTANPASVISGQKTTLSWTTANATSLTIDNAVGNVTSLSSISITPAATATYTLTASSNSGSATSQVSVSVSPDTIAPSIPTLNGSAVSPTQANLSWSSSTDNVGVAGYELYRDGSSLLQTTSTSYSDTALTAGNTYSYTVAAYDTTGNHSVQSAPVTITTTQNDTQAPSVSITSPSNNQNVSGSWTVTASANDDVGVAGVQFLLDGANLGQESATAPYSTTWNTQTTSDGAHVLTAVARDGAGHTTTSSAVTVTVKNASTAQRPYITTFNETENPISEGGQWINGQATGLDWADIQAKPGLAYGTQTGSGIYDDSTALLTGTWGPDQTVEATVHSVNQPTDNNVFEEVEIRLRSSISAHRATGYEVNFRCSQTSNAYTQIVRWNGALGDFTYLNAKAGAQYGVKNGDVVKATIIGNVITVYLNGVQIDQATDNTYSSGSPGMGFYIQGTSGANVNGDFGFSSFSASDGSTTDTAAPSVPTNLTASTVSSSQINLSWKASTDDVGVLGYQIFRNGAQIATTAIASYSDTGLTANTQYVYTVAAYDGGGFVSDQSAPASATTGTPDFTPPSTPVITQTSNITSSSATIMWSASTDDVSVAGYQVFRNGNQVGTTTSTNYSDSGLSSGITYSYTVAAFDSSNNVSGQSATYQVTTTNAPLVPPSFVQSARNQTARGSSTSASFSSSTGSGHTIVAFVIWDNTKAATITDSRGNSFVAVSAPNTWAGKYSAQVLYATNTTGGADTVTATFSQSVSSFGVLYITEYAGISTTNPVDVTLAASGASSQLNSGTVTTTSTNDLIYGAGVSDNTVTAAGSGFSARDLSFGNIVEDRVATSAGTVSATATHNGYMWGMQVVAFRPGN